MLDKEDAMEWPGTLAIVHSYIAYKAAKEEEKQRQVQWAKDLRQEREQLESRVKQLNVSITRCMESKNNVLSRQRSMQTSLEKVKGLLCLIKGLKPLSPPQTTTQPPDDPTDGGTGRVSVDPMEPATEEPGDAQNNDNTKNKDIAENNNISVTVNSHNVPEINKDTVEINKDVTENKDSRSSPGEQRRPDQGATAEEEEEEEERKEEDEVEQKQEEVKLEEERSETQEAKLPINNIVNTNKMSNMNSRATEINKDGEEGEEEEEEETVEREEDVESQEREDITKLGKEEGEEEVDETKSNVRGEEEEEEKQGEMTEEETKKEAEGPKENGNESDGEEDEEEKEERMEEESVEEEEKKERLSSLSKVSDPPLTLAPPPVGVTE